MIRKGSAVRFRPVPFTQPLDSVAQSAEHPAFNRRRAGSSPAGVISITEHLAGWPSGEGSGLQIHRHLMPARVRVPSRSFPLSQPRPSSSTGKALFRKQEVRGSSPCSGFRCHHPRARSSTAERRLAMSVVAGSSPAEHFPSKSTLSWRNRNTQRSQKPCPPGLQVQILPRALLPLCACSSTGRAPALQAGCCGFNSHQALSRPSAGHDPVAQSEEHPPSKRRAAGSSPARVMTVFSP